MQHTLRNRILFFGPTLGLGLFSFFLHRTMMSTCIDDRGLLVAGNLPGRLLWAVGIVMAVVLWRMTSTVGGNGSYADNFPRCIPSGLVAMAGGAAMVTAVQAMTFDSPWQLWLGYGAAAAMICAGLARCFGKRPPFALHGLVCLFYMGILIRSYQRWSADPQIHTYAYQLLAGVGLMLAAFHRTCCDAGIICRKKLIVTCFAAAFCALAALGDEMMPRFYLASVLWALGSVCNVAVLPPDPESGEEAPETNPDAN